MPNRCGIMHARGIPPLSNVTQVSRYLLLIIVDCYKIIIAFQIYIHSYNIYALFSRPNLMNTSQHLVRKWEAFFSLDKICHTKKQWSWGWKMKLMKSKNLYRYNYQITRSPNTLTSKNLSEPQLSDQNSYYFRQTRKNWERTNGYVHFLVKNLKVQTLFGSTYLINMQKR